MTTRDPGSFRDPSGHVYRIGNRILRTVTEAGREEYEYVRSTGVLDELAAKEWVIAAQELDPDAIPAPIPASAHVLEHPPLPFVSYPYEWPFEALKDAALLNLRVHLAALERGVTLSDASAYNIQLVGARPLFVDYLSFRRYRDGEFWYGHRQFCEQFLNPLILTACTGVPFNGWYRGSPGGIPATHLRPLLPWRRKLHWQVFTNVVLQARLESQGVLDQRSHASLAKQGLPRGALRRVLTGLETWIRRLAPPGESASRWKDYAEQNSYAAADHGAKRSFVRAFVAAARPAVLWDLGCNTGEYSEVALNAGASYAVGFDSDHGALSRAYTRAKDRGLALLTLYADATNPSPDQGWAQAERAGLAQRAGADAVLALALVHHLVIGNNVPLDQVLGWLMGLAPSGVIEFVPKNDPMVQKMLTGRADIFPAYTSEAFEAYIGAHSRLVRTERITESGRLLAWYRR